MPLVFQPEGLAAVGYSNEFPGGYGDSRVPPRACCLPVPDGLSTDLAALTEPMASASTRSRRGHPSKVDAALVIRCGRWASP